MTLFIYKRYQLTQAPGEYYVDWDYETGYPMNTDDVWWGWTSYKFDDNGQVSPDGEYTSIGGTQEGIVYVVINGSIVNRYRTNLSNYYSYSSSGYVKQHPPQTVKGAYIDFEIAEEGTYSENGQQNGFWYEKGLEAQHLTNLIPNGGEVWSGLKTISWTSSQSGLRYEVFYSFDNGNSYTQIGSTIQKSYTYDFSALTETPFARIRVDAYNGNEPVGRIVSSGVFTIKNNVAPTEPTNLAPKGRVVDLTITQRLTWNFNDPNPNDQQSKAEIAWKKQGELTWTTATIQGADTEYYIPPNTLPLGAIEWRVRTYDQESLVSPWSEIAVFTASQPTNAPVITLPDEVVTVARPVVQWTSGAQQSYQIIIENTLSEVIWDTGEVFSSAKTRTVGIDLVNGANYTIKVRIKDSGGLFSSFVNKTVRVDYTPPARPRVDVSEQRATIRLFIENPEPNGTEPVVTHNDIYRKQGNDWIRIAESIPINTEFTDYTPASGKTYEYRVRAWGDNGTYRDSDIVSDSVTFNGVWLHDVTDTDSLHNFKADGSGRESNWGVGSTNLQFAGRKHPVTYFDEQEDNSVTVTLQILRHWNDLQALERIIKAKNIVCYRDGRGRRMFGTITALPVADTPYGYEVTITVIATSYKEEV